MTTLYEIADSIREAIARTDDIGGEITPDIEQFLDSLSIELAAKADKLCKLKFELQGDAAKFTSEIERLTAVRDTLLNRAKWIHNYLHRCMMAAGETKVMTSSGLFKLAIARNGTPSIELADGADIDAIPAHFRRTKVEIALDKLALRDAWKRGEELPAGVVVKEGSHLKIH